MTDRKKLTGEEFLSSLRKEVAKETNTITVTGMAKESEESDGSIAFVPDLNCDDWVQIPLERIESIEVIGTSPCKEHTHPHINLTLKVESSLEAALLARVLSSRSFQNPPKVHRQMSGGLPIGARVPDHLTTVSRPVKPTDLVCGYGDKYVNYVCNSNCMCEYADGWHCCPTRCCYG